MKICGIAIPAYLPIFLTNQPTDQLQETESFLRS